MEKSRKEDLKPAIQDFKSLAENSIHSIAKINWWLLKYEELYNYCKENWNNNSCYGDLPCVHTTNSAAHKFVDFYSVLETAAEYHKKEKYFKEQLTLLEEIKDDYPALMQWLRENKKVALEEFFGFWIDWVDEDTKNISPFFLYWKTFLVNLDPREFENTIQFLETYNEIYWTSDLVDS